MSHTRNGWKYWARLASFAAVTAIVATVGMSLQLASGYLHPERTTTSGDLLRASGIEYQSVELTTEDGLLLSAWYTPPRNGAVILVAHGYGVQRPEEFYELFASHGYGVLAWDFRAHGQSEGEFSSLGYYEVLDIKAALDFARAQPGVQHVGAWGGSMGAVALIRATARYSAIEALVADSPFATLEDEMAFQLPFPVLRPLIRFFAEWESGVDLDWVRPVDDVSKISPRPIFIIQGLDDGMIPPDSAQRLYDAAGDPRLLWTEPDVPHLNMYSYHEQEYVKRVINFMDEYLLGP
jgi:fermentation-respiration switch protein FrsA (DUF1100 family)